MLHEEIDQGKKRRAAFDCINVPNGQSVQIVPAAPDRVLLRFLWGTTTATTAWWLGRFANDSPSSARISGIVNLEMTRDKDGDNCSSAWYVRFNGTENVNIAIWQTFEEPCDCID